MLSGDHVYKMDYAPLLAYHVEKKSQMTVACIDVPLEEAKAFGVMSIDPDYRVTAFAEKPTQP